MSTVILDDCLYHLYEANRIAADYKEIDGFMEIFEADSPQVQEQANKNKEVSAGALGHLKKAGQAILNMIKKIKDAIVNFFKKRNLSKEEREAYERFKEACKQDPALKNKKITVTNWKKVQEDYNKLLKDVEARERDAAAGREGDLEALTKEIAQFCGNAGKGVAVAVTAEAALRMASSSREMAQKIYDQISNDEKIYNTLVDSIGKKETKKLQNQVKNLTYKMSLQRLKMKLNNTMAYSSQEAISETLTDVGALVKGALGLGGTVASPAEEVVSKNLVQRAGSTASRLIKNRDDVKKDLGNVKRGSGIITKALGNEEVRTTIKDTIKTNNEITKRARQKYKQDLKAEKMAKKAANKKQPKRKIQDQSAMDSIIGRNDPNSIYNKTVGKIFK